MRAFVLRSGAFRTFTAVAALASGAARADAADIVFVSDFDNSHPIQWVRHHDVSASGVSIVVGPALVTATRVTNTTDLTTWLQVPPDLNSNPTYPEYSALKTFGSASGPVPGIGTCVEVEGTIDTYAGATEINGAVLTELPGECGSPVAPFTSLIVADVATTTDVNALFLQPGLFAEAFESVLVKLSFLFTLTANDIYGDFEVNDASSPNAYLLIANDLYQYNVSQFTVISSITGVMDEHDFGEAVYQLLPRGPADIMP